MHQCMPCVTYLWISLQTGDECLVSTNVVQKDLVRLGVLGLLVLSIVLLNEEFSTNCKQVSKLVIEWGNKSHRTFHVKYCVQSHNNSDEKPSPPWGWKSGYL